MSSGPPPNVKIYDRPERKGPPPLVLAIILIVVLAVIFFAYRAWHHSQMPPVKAQTGLRFAPTVGRVPSTAGGLSAPTARAFSLSAPAQHSARIRFAGEWA